MEKTKKTKIIIGVCYFLIISIFFIFFLSKFSLEEIKSFTNFEVIKNNRDFFFELKNSNLLLLSIFFLLFTILWVFPLLGFGSPIALLEVFPWLGTAVVVLGLR